MSRRDNANSLPEAAVLPRRPEELPPRLPNAAQHVRLHGGMLMYAIDGGDDGALLV